MADDTTIRTKIVVEGEAQYKAAMADIGRQLKETKSALSMAAAEYQNADAATRNSAAQVDALTQSLEQQQQRLALMAEHLTKVEDAYGKNSRQAVELRTKINNARAEMAKTETQLRGLTDGLDSAEGAARQAGEGMDDAAGGLAQIGQSAQDAQEDVQDLAGEIGSMVGQKLIEFEVGKKALEQLAEGVKWALGEAISGQAEDAHARALAGDDALTERRTAIKDAVDRQWAGRRDGMTTVSDVAAVDTALGNAGITDDDRVTKLTNMAITIDEVFGQGVQDTIDRATSMVNTFGVSWEDAFDLMTKGQRDFSDGGAQMLAAMENYGPAYKQLGYDIGEMYSALASAANDNALGKDSNLNKGVESFIGFVTSGSKSSQEALENLGIEANDLPQKFQAGGETAAAATQLILTSLKSISDEATRNDLGKTIFGEKIWVDSAGRIADVLLAGFDQTVEASGATADAMVSELDTLGDAMAQTKERASQEFGEMVAPAVDASKDALQTLNRNADETGGLMSGLVKSVGDANAQMAAEAANAFDQAKDSYDSWARDLATNIADGQWIEGFKEKSQVVSDAWRETAEATGQDIAKAVEAVKSGDLGELMRENMNDMLTSVRETPLAQALEPMIAEVGTLFAENGESTKTWGGEVEAAVTQAATALGSADMTGALTEAMAQQETAMDSMLTNIRDAPLAEAQEQAMSEASSGLRAQLETLDTMIATALENGDSTTAWELTAQREALLAAISQAEIDALAALDELGTGMGDTLEGQGSKYEDATGTAMEQAVGAVEASEGDMEAAGEGVGDSGTDGLGSGLSGMPGAAGDAVNGAVGALYSGKSQAYNAGYSTGKAYESGFRAATDTHSPSRVMREAAEDTVEGALLSWDDGKSEAYARGAALAKAFAGGYRAQGTPQAAPDGAYGAGVGFSPADLAEAVRSALDGVGLYFDGRRTGEAVAPGVSGSIARKSSQTVRGASARAKGW